MCICFFFNDTATTEIYTLSLHDALPISHPATAPRNFPALLFSERGTLLQPRSRHFCSANRRPRFLPGPTPRSEEHTSELQSPCNLVCRLLLEKTNERACGTLCPFKPRLG